MGQGAVTSQWMKIIYSSFEIKVCDICVVECTVHEKVQTTTIDIISNWEHFLYTRDDIYSHDFLIIQFILIIDINTHLSFDICKI